MLPLVYLNAVYIHALNLMAPIHHTSVETRADTDIILHQSPCETHETRISGQF